MVQVGRRLKAMQRLALAVLLAMDLFSPVVAGADAPPQEATAKPEPAAAGAPPKARVRRPPNQRTAAEAIDENVRRLTRGLDLTAGQQQELREILLDQHRQIMKLRTENTEPGTDRVGMNLAILDRTKARIRAMLTDEQKKKYITDVPREQTAPAQADLQHWIDIQDSKRRNGGDESK